MSLRTYKVTYTDQTDGTVEVVTDVSSTTFGKWVGTEFEPPWSWREVPTVDDPIDCAILDAMVGAGEPSFWIERCGSLEKALRLFKKCVTCVELLGDTGGL